MSLNDKKDKKLVDNLSINNLAVINEIKQLLIVKIKDKPLPFGFGEELGNEGFSDWFVYINQDGKLHGNHRSDGGYSFDPELSSLEDSHWIPCQYLLSLFQNGLSGDDLFKKIHSNFSFRCAMGSEAIKDANEWEKKNRQNRVKK